MSPFILCTCLFTSVIVEGKKESRYAKAPFIQPRQQATTTTQCLSSSIYPKLPKMAIQQRNAVKV